MEFQKLNIPSQNDYTIVTRSGPTISKDIAMILENASLLLKTITNASTCNLYDANLCKLSQTQVLVIYMMQTFAKCAAGLIFEISSMEFEFFHMIHILTLNLH